MASTEFLQTRPPKQVATPNTRDSLERPRYCGHRRHATSRQRCEQSIGREVFWDGRRTDRARLRLPRQSPAAKPRPPAAPWAVGRREQAKLEPQQGKATLHRDHARRPRHTEHQAARSQVAPRRPSSHGSLDIGSNQRLPSRRRVKSLAVFLVEPRPLALHLCEDCSCLNRPTPTRKSCVPRERLRASPGL